MDTIIEKQIDAYSPANDLEYEQAMKEVVQSIALFALWREGFFECAAFQGGTSLRILHGLPRFSEDLDFILKAPSKSFNWDKFLPKLLKTFEEFGLQSEALSKGRMDSRIRKAVIKDQSIAQQLDLHMAKQGSRAPKLKIKLEIDVEPPAHSMFDYTFLNFPVEYEVCHQDLSSNFALKIHALLCRPYLKGRDWFDFNWYIRQKVSPNLAHLGAALDQYGPWEGEQVEVTHQWLHFALLDKIEAVDWEEAKVDVERFLKGPERDSLKLWSPRLFTHQAKTLLGFFTP